MRETVVLLALIAAFAWEISKRIYNLGYKKAYEEINGKKKEVKSQAPFLERFVEAVFDGSGPFFAFVMPPLCGCMLISVFEVILIVLFGHFEESGFWTLPATSFAVLCYVYYERCRIKEEKKKQ